MEVRNVTKSDFEPMNMQEYFYAYPSNDRRQKMISGFHGTMKFLHENGYVSENMHPSMIIVLDEEAKHIRIVRIAKMPDDMDMAERKRLVQEDIKNAVVVQVGLFTGTLPYLRGNRDDILNFFKEHFDEIAQFLPEGDAPYYRGVLNGAVVYYSDFFIKKKEIEFNNLQQQTGNVIQGDFLQGSREAVNKAAGEVYPFVKNAKRDAAFIHMLIIPTVVVVLITLFAIISWVISVIA